MIQRVFQEALTRKLQRFLPLLHMMGQVQLQILVSTATTASRIPIQEHRKKTFLSQLSSARCFDGPWSEVSASPRISIQIDEYSQSDATGSRQFLDLEPTDAHVTSEDEGEISLELSKKKLSVLYKELRQNGVLQLLQQVKRWL